VESFELKLTMGTILTFRASFGAIATKQSDKLIHHSIKLVEKCHLMPSQVQRQPLRLVVEQCRRLRHCGKLVWSSKIHGLCSTKYHLMGAKEGEKFCILE
jgi:hypothetical protein